MESRSSMRASIVDLKVMNEELTCLSLRINLIVWLETSSNCLLVDILLFEKFLKKKSLLLIPCTDSVAQKLPANSAFFSLKIEYRQMKASQIRAAERSGNPARDFDVSYEAVQPFRHLLYTCCPICHSTHRSTIKKHVTASDERYPLEGKFGVANCQNESDDVLPVASMLTGTVNTKKGESALLLKFLSHLSATLAFLSQFAAPLRYQQPFLTSLLVNYYSTGIWPQFRGGKSLEAITNSILKRLLESPHGRRSFVEIIIAADERKNREVAAAEAEMQDDAAAPENLEAEQRVLSPSPPSPVVSEHAQEQAMSEEHIAEGAIPLTQDSMNDFNGLEGGFPDELDAPFDPDAAEEYSIDAVLLSEGSLPPEERSDDPEALSIRDVSCPMIRLSRLASPTEFITHVFVNMLFPFQIQVAIAAHFQERSQNP